MLYNIYKFKTTESFGAAYRHSLDAAIGNAHRIMRR